jgi:hypothetical protein
MAQELSPRDVALLQAAADGMSGLEMAQEFGIPAAKAVLRVKELLRSNDIWTDIERRQLLMQEIYALKNKLQRQNGDYINDKQAEVLLKTITAIDSVLDKQGKITDDQLAKVTQTQAKTMVALINAAFNRAKEILSEEYPDYPLAAIEQAFNQGLNEKAAEFSE